LSRTKKGKKPPGWDYWGKRPLRPNSQSGTKNKQVGIQRERAVLKKQLKEEIKGELAIATYVYKCQAYGVTDCSQAETWEISKPMRESDTVEHCPHCGREAVKQLQASPVHFKGKGWFNKTYGGKNSSN
jgi:predicted nucleic acid-binding Zn ribbon protein